MYIRPVAADLFHADGRTDMTKLTVTFSNFANTSKNKTFKPLTGHSDTKQALYLYDGKNMGEPGMDVRVVHKYAPYAVRRL